LRAPGAGPRHGGGEREARLPRRPPRLRNRRADPLRPRRAPHAASHEQPDEVPRDGRLRLGDRGARPARDAARPRQRDVPANEGRQAGAPADAQEVGREDGSVGDVMPTADGFDRAPAVTWRRSVVGWIVGTAGFVLLMEAFQHVWPTTGSLSLAELVMLGAIV